MRLIDADKADVNFINTYYSDHCRTDDVQEWLEEQPTIDAKPVKHGEWKHTDYAKHWRGKDECGVCGFHEDDRRNMSWANYCPNCGAKMDGGKET